MSVLKNAAGLYEVDVDGKRYEFQKFGADEGVDVLLDIARVAGKPLGMAIGAVIGKDEDGKSGLDKTIDPNLIGQIMDSMTQSLDKATCKALIKKFSTQNVYCDGVPVNFNTHYQDRYDHLLKVVKAALEVQYGNFLSAIMNASGIKPSNMRKEFLTRVQTPSAG